ncbi:sushi, von Willebrand factor type A, EGF and pentraxin domain-containing protein 1 [Trichonephila inaurata madagascariensis]|uniref:Sushi, von Willebrand factor type A, EGF and pentraxin domain-containing protein 1 n=1 Tax=Trichonephila inaurata madagascariensis TaxID=2747483 RepID=A0A8X7C5I5_9ARAC|nr:sushi, von Willebrand factor type A, EGF and pentraxin domain-containing protein 1 [Trichonephila inaurata madagascariensis]
MLLWILLANFVTKAFSCGYPGSPSHSIVTFNTETVQTGTVATYRCDPGFDLLGPIRRLCVENGTWIPIGIPVCVMNVAAGKAAMQSSIFSKGVPQKAVDGTTSRTYGSDTCTLTEVEDTPWWYVNLLEPFLVQLVRVDFGRSCCANGVPATVIVRVGNSRPDLSANPICNRFSGKIEEGRPLFFPCTSTVTGAFVSVHVETPTQFSLSICETFVYTDQVVPVEQCPEFDQEAATVATYNGKCYLFYSSNPRTLDSATKFCALQGGSLIHDTSPALQGFLSWELYKRHRKNPGSDYWNGVIRKNGSKDWKWVDGKDVTISFWSHPPKEGNCSRFDGKNGWLWSDTDCLNEFNYICEHRPAICGKPERPVNSTLMVRANTVGSTIEYQCNPGHLLLGPSTRTCQPTGFFSEFAPKCSYLECGFPANIPNGGYSLVNGTKHFQSIVQYFCQESYILVGQPELMCDADRKWDGPPPRCDPLLCHNPPSIKHGNVTVTVNTTVPGTTAEYVCENNFKLIGEAVISCDSTGFWTSKPPTCELDKEKLYNARIEGKHKRNRASIAARLNMGGIIALGIFGGFVFLAVIISIVVIIVRRNSNSQDSLDSLSTYESQGSREKLYQRQCWPGHPGSLHPSVLPPPDDPDHRKGNSDRHREPSTSTQYHLRHHQHGNSHRDSDISLETTASTPRWCKKHEKRSGY